MKPTELSSGSHKLVWWLCPKKCEYGCAHEWETRVYHRTGPNRTGCPYCSGCITCYHKSLEFKFPDLTLEWHPKNEMKPSEVSYGSPKLVWWLCPKKCEYGCAHEWEAKVYHRTGSGSGCPHCIVRYSKISLQWLEYINLTTKIRYGSIETGGELRIPDTKYYADGFNEQTRTVYEFHGDMWHGNPKMFDKDSINPISKITYGELYEKTQQKKRDILDLGYNYIEMWEYDWRRGIKLVIKIQRVWRKTRNLNVPL
jgi:hypothetical protein